jgi:hypothetical protein
MFALEKELVILLIIALARWVTLEINVNSPNATERIPPIQPFAQEKEIAILITIVHAHHFTQVMNVNFPPALEKMKLMQ